MRRQDGHCSPVSTQRIEVRVMPRLEGIGIEILFDQYGTYLKSISITGLNSFQVTERAIFFIQENEIRKYDFKRLEIESLPLPEEKVKRLSVDKNRLYVLTDQSVKIYDYIEN